MRVAAWLGSCTTAIVLGAALGVGPAYAQVGDDAPVVCLPGDTTGAGGTAGASDGQQSGQATGVGNSVAGAADALLGTGTPSAGAGGIVAQREPGDGTEEMPGTGEGETPDSGDGTPGTGDGSAGTDEDEETVTGPGTCVEDDVDFDCADFANQQAAQRYFLSQGGSATNNVDNLDADNDGVACESLADDGDDPDEEVDPVGDDGSGASTGGGQVEDVPVGSASTGGA